MKYWCSDIDGEFVFLKMTNIAGVRVESIWQIKAGERVGLWYELESGEEVGRVTSFRPSPYLLCLPTYQFPLNLLSSTHHSFDIPSFCSTTAEEEVGLVVAVPSVKE